MQNSGAYIKICHQVVACGVKNRVSHLTFLVDFPVTSIFAVYTYMLL